MQLPDGVKILFQKLQVQIQFLHIKKGRIAVSFLFLLP